MNDDIIYGRNPVIEALEAGNTAIDRILLQDGLKHSQIVYIRKLAKEHGIQYKFADKRRLDSACGGENHQGVIAYTAAHKYAEIEDIFAAAAEKGEAPFIVITDGITDPHNLGSIIRTANAAGAHGVIIPKNRNAALNAVVSKVSAGAVEYTPVARVTNLKSTIEKLKKQGIWVVGTDLSAKMLPYECDLTGPIAVVIGSEGEGMSRLVREACDFMVKIPMLGSIESLNASVAAGVLLYEAVRQRSKI